jgi:hypothetical protein
MKTFAPLEFSVKMVAAMTLGLRVLMHSLVPLHIFGGSMLRNSIMGVSTFTLVCVAALDHLSGALRSYGLLIV